MTVRNGQTCEAKWRIGQQQDQHLDTGARLQAQVYDREVARDPMMALL